MQKNIQQQLVESVKRAGVEVSPLFEGVNRSEIEFLAEQIQLNEGIAENVVSKIEQYRALLIEKANEQWFFMTVPGKIIYAFKFDNGRVTNTQKFKNEKDADEFIKPLLASGFIVMKKQSKLKNIVKLYLGTLSSVFAKIGRIALIIGVAVLLIGIAVLGTIGVASLLPASLAGAIAGSAIGKVLGIGAVALGGKTATIGLAYKGIGWVTAKVSSNLDTLNK